MGDFEPAPRTFPNPHQVEFVIRGFTCRPPLRSHPRRHTRSAAQSCPVPVYGLNQVLRESADQRSGARPLRAPLSVRFFSAAACATGGREPESDAPNAPSVFCPWSQTPPSVIPSMYLSMRQRKSDYQRGKIFDRFLTRQPGTPGELERFWLRSGDSRIGCAKLQGNFGFG